MNKCSFIGNLTKDVELKPIGDTKVAKFSIAVSKTIKNKAGQKEKKVSYVDFVCWGTKGEAVASYFKKGNPIIITDSEYEPESWEDKETKQKRTRAVFRVNDWEFPPINEKKSHGDSTDNTSDSDNDTTPSGGADNEVPF